MSTCMRRLIQRRGLLQHKYSMTNMIQMREHMQTPDGVPSTVKARLCSLSPFTSFFFLLYKFAV
jgi:hypothetical protein